MVKIVTFCSFLCKEYIEIIKCIAIFKVVDKVWHDGIIFKLKQSGISDNTLNLLYNFLIIRAQKVVLKGQASSLAHVTAWVRKGSTFGPVLFLKDINDLTDDLSNGKLFAVGISLFSVVRNLNTSSDEVSNDLVKISKRA